jgi:hypothetical protein
MAQSDLSFWVESRGCPKSPHFSFGTAQSGRKWRETGRKSMLYPKIDKKNDQKWEKKKGLSAFETAPSGPGWDRTNDQAIMSHLISLP